MNKFIAALLNRTISMDKNILGRWRIDYCDRKINNKIDWSNVDHCGSCGTEKMEIAQENGCISHLPKIKNGNK